MKKAYAVQCTTYDVVVGHNLLEELPDDLVKYVPASRYVLITDENVNQSNGEELKSAFKKALTKANADVS